MGKVWNQKWLALTQSAARNTAKSSSDLLTKDPTVPDLASRIRDVVLVRRIFSSGKPRGGGNLEGEGNGEGMERGGSVYKQPGTKVDGILSCQRGFPSK